MKKNNTKEEVNSDEKLSILDIILIGSVLIFALIGVCFVSNYFFQHQKIRAEKIQECTDKAYSDWSTVISIFNYEHGTEVSTISEESAKALCTTFFDR